MYAVQNTNFNIKLDYQTANANFAILWTIVVAISYFEYYEYDCIPNFMIQVKKFGIEFM